MSEKRARQIVEDIFEDLRDRRFLKWLFDERGEDCFIGFLGGDRLTGLALDTQKSIADAWVRILIKGTKPVKRK